MQALHSAGDLSTQVVGCMPMTRLNRNITEMALCSSQCPTPQDGTLLTTGHVIFVLFLAASFLYLKFTIFPFVTG
jgi:hypothetical protein